ncbi:Chitin bind 4 domain containing protein [Asbolus verrucosus]|uniref:Chitin bind 4 domain containing protein n=1 Tax=Asbolus verrucosus TaxID=1661398 RepID=A0A482VUQ4_ASBVE|nr:Chitin bind 4 domain containing protein [Asbolus verrucosus]
MRVVLVVMIYLHCASSDEGSYSYHKFRGPVSGQIHQILVPDHNQNRYHTVDYVAKPDYLYSYGVEDPETGNSQRHKEMRDGDAVIGEYKVLQADGVMRIVKYTADGQNGFRATIQYEKP